MNFIFKLTTYRTFSLFDIVLNNIFCLGYKFRTKECSIQRSKVVNILEKRSILCEERRRNYRPKGVAF